MEQSSTDHVNDVVMTAELVAAYVSNNPIRTSDLPDLIIAVHSALSSLGVSPPEPAVSSPVPAVPIKKSVTPGYLVSLEDGKHYQTLKRHLSKRGMTPTDYRTKWNLPSDYPMIALNYAKRRSDLAKAIGLGRKPAPAPEPEPARRGRKKAA